MSNARKGNVIVVDTTADFTDTVQICGIKYIGAASGTAALKLDTNAAGTTVWSEAGATNVWNPELEINAMNGFGVTVTNSAVVYIYIR